MGAPPYHARMARALTALLTCLLLAACGSPAPSPTAKPTATPTPRATPTPLPPDTERIDVVSSGVGAYQLVAVPVAVVHNAATRTAAVGVVVHLTPTRGGGPTTPLQTSPLTIYPGETLVVSANYTDTCNDADGATVTVTPGTWSVLVGGPPTAKAPAYTCRGGCGGHGFGDVTTTITAPDTVKGTRMDLFVACSDASGALIGGGQRQVSWPQNGGSLDLDIPVIVSTAVASCQVGASTA